MRYTLKEIVPPQNREYIFDVGGMDTRLSAVQIVAKRILRDNGWISAKIYEGTIPLATVRVTGISGDHTSVD